MIQEKIENLEKSLEKDKITLQRLRYRIARKKRRLVFYNKNLKDEQNNN